LLACAMLKRSGKGSEWQVEFIAICRLADGDKKS
jgi:hypothetical protein